MRSALAKILAAALGLAIGQPVYAAYAYVTSSAASTNTIGGTPNPTITLGAAVPVNGLIVTCGASYGGEFPASVPTDTNSNLYAAFGADATDGSSTFGNCWYAINNTNNAPTVTQHWTGVTDNTFSYVAAYTGNATSSVLVASNVATLSSATTQTCASAAASASGQLVTGFVATTNGATSFAPASSETERLEEATYHQTQIEDKTSSGAGSIAPTWTLGAAQPGLCVMGIFALPGGASGTMNPLEGATKPPRFVR